MPCGACHHLFQGDFYFQHAVIADPPLSYHVMVLLPSSVVDVPDPAILLHGLRDPFQKEKIFLRLYTKSMPSTKNKTTS